MKKGDNRRKGMEERRERGHLNGGRRGGREKRRK